MAKPNAKELKYLLDFILMGSYAHIQATEKAINDLKMKHSLTSFLLNAIC